MKKLLLPILLIFLLFSCMSDSKKTKLRYLALGDSYTIGESVDAKDRFPVILVDSLKARGLNMDSAQIIATTGWTTDELMEGIKQAQVTGTYDYVSLLIGVNNQYRGRDAEEFRVQFAELLEMAIKFAGDKNENVFVVSIPDWGVSPFAEGRDLEKISNEINQFNSLKKSECEKRNICFVDITNISRMASEHKHYLAADNLHFSGEMHALWVNEILTNYFDK